MKSLPARLVLALVAVLIAAATVISLGRERSRILGSNSIGPSAFTIVLRSDDRACQGGTVPSRGADEVRLTIGSFGRRNAEIRVDAPGVGKGLPTRIKHEGVVDIPLPAQAWRARSGLCIANVGRRRVAIAGGTVPRRSGAVLNRRAVKGVFSATYLGPRRLWRDDATTMIARVGYVKGLPGGRWTGALALLSLVLCVTVAIGSCWRWLRP
jgi:hypothetical protein